MEIYLIVSCDRLHDVAQLLAVASVFISFICTLVYFSSKGDIGRSWVTEEDYKLIKVSKIALVVCLVVFAISLLLFIFIPTGEEVRLIMQNN